MFEVPMKIENEEREFLENLQEDTHFITGLTRYKKFPAQTENFLNNVNTASVDKYYFADSGTSNRTKNAADNNICHLKGNFIDRSQHRLDEPFTAVINEPDFMYIDVATVKMEWPKTEPGETKAQQGDTIFLSNADNWISEISSSRSQDLDYSAESRRQDVMVSHEDIETDSLVSKSAPSERIRYESPLPELSKFFSESLLYLPPLSPPPAKEFPSRFLPEKGKFRDRVILQDSSGGRLTRSAIRLQTATTERSGSHQNGPNEPSSMEDRSGSARQESSGDESEKDFEKAKDMRNILKSYHKGGINTNDSYIYCDLCNRKWKGSCSVHGAYTHIMDSWVPLNTYDRAMRTAPEGHIVSTSGIKGADKGVWTCQEVPARYVYGPYKGVTQPSNHGCGEYCWEVLKDGKVSHHVDATNPAKSNWMRYVNCARNVSEQNLEAFQYRGKIYYRAMRKIQPNEELLVWYGFHFAAKLGIEWRNFVQPMTPEQTVGSLNNELTTEEKCPTLQNYLLHKSLCPRRSSACMKVTTGDKPISCGVCGARFRRRGSLLENHMRTHEGAKHDCCNICGLWFQHKVSLKIHATCIHGKQVKKAGWRNRNERSISTDDDTVHSVTDRKLFTCFECKSSFYSKTALERHIRRRNANIMKGPACSDKYVNTSLEVTECSAKTACYDSRRGQKRNLVTQSTSPTKKKQGISCRQNRSQTTSQELCRLLADMNQSLTGEGSNGKCTNTNNPTDTTIFREAEQVLKSLKKRLDDSQSKRTDPRLKPAETTAPESKRMLKKTLLCEMCGALFWRKVTLQTHLQIRHDVPSNRKNSVFSMDNLKRFKCNLCGIRYREKSTLELHLRIHEKDTLTDDHEESDCADEKPFECKKCGVGFKAEMTLKYHMRIHKDETLATSSLSENILSLAKDTSLENDGPHNSFKKPFKCNECGTRYRALTTLDAHMKIHRDQSSTTAPSTSKSYFSCTQCKSLFNTIYAYEAHLNTHDIPSSASRKESKAHTGNSSSSNTEPTHKPAKKCVEKSFRAVRKTSESTDDREIKQVKTNKCNSDNLSASISDNYSLPPLRGSSCETNQSLDDTMSVDSLNETEISRGKESTLPKLQIPMHGEKEKASLQCNDCNCHFHSSIALESHKKKAHSSTLTYECLACGISFKERQSLDVHVRKHIGERELFCDLSAVRISAYTNN